MIDLVRTCHMTPTPNTSPVKRKGQGFGGFCSSVKQVALMLISAVTLLATYPAYASTPTPAPTGDPVIIAVGDIASCSSPGDELTAALVDKIPGTILAVGDIAYEHGSADDFTNCYNPSWGRFKNRTRPAPGNHDYVTRYAQGYYDYFGELAGPPNQGYYSFDVGAWHIISLDSNVDARVVGTQGKWLRADLKAHPGTCTLAFWHHPIFSTDISPDTNYTVKQLWWLLYLYGADVIINGHVHYYERFAPQTSSGQSDPQRGIREFVVGTGGAFLLPKIAAKIAPNSEVIDNVTWGVLKMTLHSTSYDWEFIPVEGKTFHDSGSASCVNAPQQWTF